MGGWGRGGDGVMNWEIGIDMCTLICIKWITNKNLLYKKIKFQNSKKNKRKRKKKERKSYETGGRGVPTASRRATVMSGGGSFL